MKNLFIILLLMFSGVLFGQQNLPEGKKMAPEKIRELTIRPNSRDYGGVYRNNLHQRIEHRRKLTRQNQQKMIQRRKAVLNRQKNLQKKRMMLIKKKRAIRQKRIQRRMNH
jgi:hypothetical protein